MRRILRVYIVSTTVCICLISLIVGTVIAKNNTRKLGFGEKYNAVEVYDSDTDVVIVNTGENEYGLSNKIVDRAKDITADLEPLYPAVINNFNWFVETIEKAL